MFQVIVRKRKRLQLQLYFCVTVTVFVVGSLLLSVTIKINFSSFGTELETEMTNLIVCQNRKQYLPTFCAHLN